MNSLVSAMAAVKLDERQDCIICQETFAIKNMERRICGHITCENCDDEWRRRAAIVCTKKDAPDSTNRKKQIYQYHIESTCPMCRAVDTFDNYESRSKKSLAKELSLALGFIFRRKVYKLEEAPIVSRRDRQVPAPPVQPIIADNYNPHPGMDDLTYQIIQQLIANGQIEGTLVPPDIVPIAAPVPRPPVAPVPRPPVAPARPPVAAPVRPPAAAPVRPPVAPAPVRPPAAAPVPVAPRIVIVDPEPHHAYGVIARPVGRPRQPRTDICYNREHNLGCYTEKTKMKCSHCLAVVLCRSCKEKCPNCNRA